MSTLSETSNAKPDNQALMGTGFIIGLILIGVFAFSALIGLSGYAEDIKDKNNGQAHALSTSAIGFAGLHILLEDLNQNVSLDANEAQYFKQDTLRIYTLNSAFQTDVLDELNPEAPKLIVLPKWNVFPQPKAPGWVQKTPYGDAVINGKNLASNLENLMQEISFEQIGDDEGQAAIEYKFLLENTGENLKSRLPRLQMIKANNLLPIMRTAEGAIVLGKIEDTQTYILSDPDFLNTSGLRTKSGAKFAVDILEYIKGESGASSYTLDLALHGIGGKRNMIKLFTQPPFLSITLLMAALLGLMGWQAFLRFGDPKRGSSEDFGENMQMGPQSLTITTAEFLSLAKRETEIMTDYANMVRGQALEEIGLQGRDNSRRFEALYKRETVKGITPTFQSLFEASEQTTQKQEMIRLAKALQDWKKDITQ